MSNFLAIASVTAVLKHMLQAAVSADVEGAAITTARPDGSGNGTPAVGINLYLYQVSPNAAWRNADLPTRRSDGQLAQRPNVALDLHYLLSFYGADNRLEPQRLLGSAVRTLHTRPVLTRQMIGDTIRDAAHDPGLDFMARSDLADAVELVKFTPLPLSLEELAKLWSVFFQTAYALSVAYHGSVVLIESAGRPQPGPPVLERRTYVVPLREPFIERVVGATTDQPIIAERALRILGQRLRGEITSVRVGGVEARLSGIRDTQIDITLPAGLSAGLHGVQVIHAIAMGEPPVPHRGVESNMAAVVLHPVIDRAHDGTFAIDVTHVVGSGSAPRSADVAVTLTPPVGKHQWVQLELLADATIAYTFAAAPVNADSARVAFQVAGVQPRTYVVRVRVDGAESPLDLDANQQPIEPQVTIP